MPISQDYTPPHSYYTWINMISEYTEIMDGLPDWKVERFKKGFDAGFYEGNLYQLTKDETIAIVQTEYALTRLEIQISLDIKHVIEPEFNGYSYRGPSFSGDISDQPFRGFEPDRLFKFMSIPIEDVWDQARSFKELISSDLETARDVHKSMTIDYRKAVLFKITYYKLLKEAAKHWLQLYTFVVNILAAERVVQVLESEQKNLEASKQPRRLITI